MPIVIRLHDDATNLDRKKLEKLIRNMDPTITEPIEFVVAEKDDGKVVQSKRGVVE